MLKCIPQIQNIINRTVPTVSKCLVNVDIDKISLVKPARAKYIIEKTLLYYTYFYNGKKRKHIDMYIDDSTSISHIFS